MFLSTSKRSWPTVQLEQRWDEGTRVREGLAASPAHALNFSRIGYEGNTPGFGNRGSLELHVVGRGRDALRGSRIVLLRAVWPVGRSFCQTCEEGCQLLASNYVAASSATPLASFIHLWGGPYLPLRSSTTPDRTKGSFKASLRRLCRCGIPNLKDQMNSQGI